MAKVSIKSEKITPFGGIFHVREQFSRYAGLVITANTTYTSDTGKSYDFNTATKLNRLLVKALLSTGQLMAGASYDLDFDHQFIETEKYDAKMTYKKFFASEANKFERTGYSPGVAVIGDLIVGIENRDGRSALGTLCKQRMPTCVSTSRTHP